MGAFEEGSKDLHTLGTMTDSILSAMGLGREREGTEHKRSVLLAGYRRVLSTAAAKASCLSTGPSCQLT